MVSLLGILRDEGEAGGRGGSSGYTCSDESYSANDMSRNEMGYRTAVTNVCHSTDETHHGSQIADDGQAYFAAVLYVWIICRMMVPAVANSAIHIIPKEKTTGPATNRFVSVPMSSTKVP